MWFVCSALDAFVLNNALMWIWRTRVLLHSLPFGAYVLVSMWITAESGIGHRGSEQVISHPGARRRLVICGSAPFSPHNYSLPPLCPLPAWNWPGSTAGHAVLHRLDEVIISRPLTTSKINSFWNSHNGGLTCRDISIISCSPPLSSLSPLVTSKVWFIPGLMRGGDPEALGRRFPTKYCSPERRHTARIVKSPEDDPAFALFLLWKPLSIINPPLRLFAPNRSTSCRLEKGEELSLGGTWTS